MDLHSLSLRAEKFIGKTHGADVTYRHVTKAYDRHTSTTTPTNIDEVVRCVFSDYVEEESRETPIVSATRKARITGATIEPVMNDIIFPTTSTTGPSYQVVSVARITANNVAVAWVCEVVGPK